MKMVKTPYEIINELKSNSVKNVILDTDAYNEIDDQYAIAYAMQSSDRVNLLALCAAPFLNNRSTSAGDGMIQSYNEIFKITKLTDKNRSIPIYKGSDSFLSSKDVPVESEAADKIAEIVMNSAETVYIVAIGAITNVASAIIKHPEIVDKAVVVWLGGHALSYPDTAEFNLKQDVFAAQVVFDSNISLVQIPCFGVCSEFLTTIPELEYYMSEKNELCDYLLDVTKNYTKNPYAWSKVIWDVTAVALFTVPSAYDIAAMPRPFVTSDKKYAFDMARAPYVYVRRLRRDPIYADLFKKLTSVK
ncbi:MAG: nucleoside hydrolase [Clostridia bacterium]|nr:nucleoside hydrolase [Clostridia bacterium]